MTRTRIWPSLMCGLVCAAMMGFGCGSGSNSGGSETAAKGGGKTLTIAVIPKGSTHDYWKSVHEGADNAAKELGVDIKFKGPEQENDRAGQIDVVQNFVTNKVDGIVLAPLDEKALVAPVKQAEDAGIPVVIIDSGLAGGSYVSFDATNNEKGGQMAGEYLGKILNGKGSVIMLRYEVGSASTEAREKGFLEAIAKFPGIKVVSSDQYGHTTADTAQRASESLLAQYKKGDGLSIDGIYTPNESTTFGMLRTLVENHWTGKVKFVGFDASQNLLEGLRNGQIDGLIVQNPRYMGYIGVKTLVDYIRGNKNVPKAIDTGATLITKANMDTPENQKLLALPKE